ncbi:MAG: c-type cytochrome [Anaerolineae bacterium]|nr:c-type cytochrome [Anaerolineae bacterium]
MAATATRFLRLSGALLLIGWLMFAFGRSAGAQTPPADPLEPGRQLYNANCAVCHGVDGQGRIGAALAKDWPSIRPDLTVETIIETGVPGAVMPAWSVANGGPLSPAEIDAIVQYILSWQTGGAPQITPPPTATLLPPITPIPEIDGDPNQGARLFAENCAVCHGEQAQGRIGAALAKNWAGIRPDLNLRAIISNGVSGSQMPAWSAARGGPLSDGDIQDLVAFILTLSAKQAQAAAPSPAASPAPGESPFSGWGGVAALLALLLVIVGLAALIQRRKP